MSLKLFKLERVIFEMESDTSESSDEELDKQNQAPIDCPTADDEEVEATKPSQTIYRTTPQDRYRWLKKDFTSPCTNFSGPDVTSGAVNLHTPLEYFQRFVSEDMIQALTENTNVYSLQKNGTCLNTSNKEIEQMIGMYLKMGLMQMSGVRMYRETDTRYTPVSDVMPRNRFQSLLTSLHFVNNLTVSEAQKKDKLWKLRAWLASFREKCLLVVPEEHYNKHMGDVDLLDSFAAKYKFPMKSRWWYIYIFWHTITLSVINAWPLYKRDCKACNIPKKEILNRRGFQAQLASSLILVNSIPPKPKRGRPSLGRGSPVSPVTSRSPLTV
ncbi:hypothetical protein SRHO_G00084880 [Serrasalmus rhombeus]